MPKLKTKKAAAKRFKVTGTGKVKRNKSNTQHILGKKSRKRKRNLSKREYAFSNSCLYFIFISVILLSKSIC